MPSGGCHIYNNVAGSPRVRRKAAGRVDPGRFGLRYRGDPLSWRAPPPSSTGSAHGLVDGTHGDARRRSLVWSVADRLRLRWRTRSYDLPDLALPASYDVWSRLLDAYAAVASPVRRGAPGPDHLWLRAAVNVALWNPASCGFLHGAAASGGPYQFVSQVAGRASQIALDKRHRITVLPRTREERANSTRRAPQRPARSAQDPFSGPEWPAAAAYAPTPTPPRRRLDRRRAPAALEVKPSAG
jgi:hypothetical protein